MATLTSAPLRHQFGDPLRPTWGHTYDQLIVRCKCTREEFDQVLRDTLTQQATEEPTVRQEAKALMENFADKWHGNGMGELSALELLARLDWLLREIREKEQVTWRVR